MTAQSRHALVTGATGYLGGRLVPELLAQGWRVRVLVRDSGKLRDRPWAAQVSVVEGDADDGRDLRRAMSGVQVAYYLIHSMDGGGQLAERDRAMARGFGEAGADSEVQRIVYLGGLHPPGRQLSAHLGSRKEVGELLLASGVPTAVLQAGTIIGSGSASFEMLRHLTERLPVMVTPKWVDTRIQPIAIRDVLHYLVAAAALPSGLNRSFDVGGPDVLTYREMMQTYARLAGLSPRLIRSLPVLTPWLASHWVGVVTPVPAWIAKPLVGSLVHEVICKEHDLERYVSQPPGGLLGFEDSVRLALRTAAGFGRRGEDGDAPLAPSDSLPGDPEWAGPCSYTDERCREVAAKQERVWSVLADLADRLEGGRDGWQVELVEPGRRLRLQPTGHLPGRGWVEYQVVPGPRPGTAVLRQCDVFVPRGLAGQAYHTAAWPARRLAARRIQDGLVRAAEARAAE